jgi:hypothetical protein
MCAQWKEKSYLLGFIIMGDHKQPLSIVVTAQGAWPRPHHPCMPMPHHQHNQCPQNKPAPDKHTHHTTPAQEPPTPGKSPMPPIPNSPGVLDVK